MSGRETDVCVISEVIQWIDVLLEDLVVHNPEYEYAWDIAENPAIQQIASTLNMNGMYFALPTDRGVTFDIERLKAIRQSLLDEQIIHHD